MIAKSISYVVINFWNCGGVLFDNLLWNLLNWLYLFWLYLFHWFWLNLVDLLLLDDRCRVFNRLLLDFRFGYHRLLNNLLAVQRIKITYICLSHWLNWLSWLTWLTSNIIFNYWLSRFIIWFF